MLCSNWRPTLLTLALASLLPLSSAHACGPEFPYRLLEDRENALRELPEGNFSLETRRLGQPIPGLGQAGEATLEPYWDSDNSRYLDARVVAEKQQLTPEQLALTNQLRSLQDARQAERDGAALPAELRLYTAGAVAFAEGDHALAADYFQQVLALPVAERPLRSTWASYSLARSQAALVNSAADDVLDDTAIAERSQHYRQQAQRNFQQVREQVAAGLADPLELGIASLGEEARLLLDAGDWGGAIRLYASQSLHNSSTGYSSLRQVARELASLSNAELLPLLSQPEVQQLLTAQILSQIDDYDAQTTMTAKRLLGLLQRAEVKNLKDADRLAAISYQSADYAGAKKLLEQASDTGLAWWLRAKLALREGDKNAATQAYAKAAKAFPADEDWGWRRSENWQYETLKPQCRVQGESAILAMERGDYLDAFDLLYRSGETYWQDAAEVAERVLSTDELKAYVDEHVTAIPTKADEEDYVWDRPLPNRLRQLLARRMLREQRYDEATAYFPSAALQQAARDYGNARQAGENAWSRTARAEAYYQAATLARVQGMELLGYELNPDNAWTAGAFGTDQPKPVKAGGLLTSAEAELQNATQAEPNRRFHYRWVAAELANRSADLLPERSQAFAAVLCKATDWVINKDYPQARTYYQRYIDHGAYLEWAGAFGTQTCPEPDFQAAGKRVWFEREQAVRQALRPYKYALPVGLLIVAGGLLYWKRRRAALAIVAKTKEDSRNE
ncbi:hypothetical protein [Pseudomonas sp. Marseille-Q8238]